MGEPVTQFRNDQSVVQMILRSKLQGMKIFVISQPKAGTYLCANILNELGFVFCGMHMGERKFEVYPDPSSKHYARAMKNPAYPINFEYRVPLKKSIRSVLPGQYAVGHLVYNKENQSILKKIKKIVLTRPIDEILVSVQKWDKHTQRKVSNLETMKDRCAKIEPWMQDPEVFHMTFDQMKIDAGRINQLQKFLGIKKKHDSAEVIKQALSKPSMTKIT